MKTWSGVLALACLSQVALAVEELASIDNAEDCLPEKVQRIPGKPCKTVKPPPEIQNPGELQRLPRRPQLEAPYDPKAKPNPQEPRAIEPPPKKVDDRWALTNKTPLPKGYAPVAGFSPVPDVARLTRSLNIVEERWFDPYNFNILKADRPVFDEWFFSVSAISDTVYEPRRLPIPVAPQIAREFGDNDIFGDENQTIFSQNVILAFVLYEGDTVFRPPDYEFRFTPVFNFNRVETEEFRALRIDPRTGETRQDWHTGIQELFVDKHLGDLTDRYDFYSIRVGIQPFSTDFRGFLFQDNQLGIRFFGNYDNNIFQYNLAWFRRVEKDTNSGLNDLNTRLRDDDVFIANLYWQDFPRLGFMSQATVVYNRNREDEALYFDKNGFLVRPASIGQERLRHYDVTYLGYNGDGHFGRLNLTTSFYYAIGDESVGTFTSKPSDIRAFFGAAEASMDFDWLRVRLSALYASGDDNPFDDRSEGFDAIFENPIFAWADTSFWVRQNVPLVGGGGVTLSGRNSVLNSLRSSKEQGQSNFTNPGMRLIGIGADMDLLPELRLTANISKLYFDDTATLEVARNQGQISSDIGWDLSLALIYRPFFTQNIVFRLSGAYLAAGDGFEALYGDDGAYSVLANLISTY